MCDVAPFEFAQNQNKKNQPTMMIERQSLRVASYVVATGKARVVIIRPEMHTGPRFPGIRLEKRNWTATGANSSYY